jgi:hypothetical protein
VSWIAGVIQIVKTAYDSHSSIQDAADPENYEDALFVANVERQKEQSQLDSLQSQLDTAETSSMPLHTPRSKYAAYGLSKVTMPGFGQRIASNINTDTEMAIGKAASIEAAKVARAISSKAAARKIPGNKVSGSFSAFGRYAKGGGLNSLSPFR